MKRILQVAVIFGVLLPLCSVTRAETMEERKKRIQSKYLRERQSVTQLDMVIPELEEENAPGVVNTRREDSSPELSRRQGAPRPMPVVAPPAQEEEQNWWQEYLEAGNDPYADPFAPKPDDAAASHRDDLWENWYRLQEEQNAAADVGTIDNSRGSRSPSISRGSSGIHRFTTERRTGYSTFSSQDSDITGRFTTERRTGYSLGTSQDRGTGRADGSRQPGLLESRDDGFATPGMLPGVNDAQQSGTRRTPYTTSSARGSRQVPGRSTNQTREENPAQSTQPQPRRATPYEQWQERNKTWDPTADDAYVNELMRRD